MEFIIKKKLLKKFQSEEKVKIGILIDRNDIDFFSFEIIDWLEKNNKKYKIYFLDQNLKKIL